MKWVYGSKGVVRPAIDSVYTGGWGFQPPPPLGFPVGKLISIYFTNYTSQIW
jgi:hypothetical protein